MVVLLLVLLILANCQPVHDGPAIDPGAIRTPSPGALSLTALLQERSVALALARSQTVVTPGGNPW